MKVISEWSILASFVMLIVSFVGYAQEPQESPKEFPYKTWQFLYEEKCSKCHTLERVFAEHKTEDEWRVCVTRMIQKSWVNRLLMRSQGNGRILLSLHLKRKHTLMPNCYLLIDVQNVIQRLGYLKKIRQRKNGRKLC